MMSFLLLAVVCEWSLNVLPCVSCSLLALIMNLFATWLSTSLPRFLILMAYFFLFNEIL